MKIYFIVAFIAIWTNSYAQKGKNDPTYSEHNYKHPNKATKAALEPKRQLLEIRYIKSIAPPRSYKAQNTIITTEPQVRAVIKTRIKATRGNYKQQFPARESN